MVCYGSCHNVPMYCILLHGHLVTVWCVVVARIVAVCWTWNTCCKCHIYWALHFYCLQLRRPDWNYSWVMQWAVFLAMSSYTCCLKPGITSTQVKIQESFSLTGLYLSFHLSPSLSDFLFSQCPVSETISLLFVITVFASPLVVHVATCKSLLTLLS